MTIETTLWTPADPRQAKNLDQMITDLGESASTEDVALALSGFTKRLLPYKQQVHRARIAELATTQGGNCYARAEALGSLMAEQGMQSAISLEASPGSTSHASNVTTDEVGKPLYIDTGTGLTYRYSGARLMVADTLWEAHQDFMGALPSDPLDTTPYAAYFWTTPDNQVVSHRVKANISEAAIPDGVYDLHIVTSLQTGIEMLHAIGDLSRYRSDEYQKKHGPEQYEAAWAELNHAVPSFMDMPAPEASLAHA